MHSIYVPHTTARPPSRPSIVLTGLPSDAHTWNLVFLELFLQEQGHDVNNVGGSAPIDAVVAACRRQPNSCLVVSTVNGHGVGEGLELIQAVRAEPDLERIRAVIGGKLTVTGRPQQESITRLVDAGYDAVFTEFRPAEFTQSLHAGSTLELV